MRGMTAVCRECKKRFHLSRHSNRFCRASSTTIKNSRFCSAKCKQAAWRKRNVGRLKPALGINTHRAVTSYSQAIENTKGIRAPKTVIDAEIYARYRWEDHASPDGVRIMVAELRPSALVRR
jgi:hypothetical protein